MMKKFGFTKTSLVFYVIGFIAVLLGTGILSVTVGFTWLAFAGVYSVAAGWVLFTIAVFKEMRLTKSPTDSMKELLDRIVREYTSGPCTVIDLTFKTPEMRDAICAKLTDKLLGDLYREAAEETKVVLDEDPKFYTRAIECKWPNNVNGNEGTKNIQVKQN